MNNVHSKTVPEAITELRDELKEFIGTRVSMLRSELSDKMRTIRMAAPVVVVGFVVLLTAWLLFTAFLVCIIAQAFAPSPWAFSISFVLVSVLYLMVGGAAAYLGWKQLRESGLKPERTIRVLEQDRIWLQTEAKSQL
ncbi:MAG TPA: phage holin family protein [Terriglobales bacterium]|nr:phage holin family protein [Terriglobales bacterium]